MKPFKWQHNKLLFMCASFLGKEVVWESQNTLSSICSTVPYSRERSWGAQCGQIP